MWRPPRHPDIYTAPGFFEERADFLQVRTAPSRHGWDVVLRVDGTYFSEEGAEGAAEGIRDWLHHVFAKEGIRWIGWEPSPEPPMVPPARPRRQRQPPNGATTLYRLLAADGSLLYVGIAAHWQSRLTTHALEKSWWPQVAGVRMEGHADRSAALAAERRAIAEEKPRYNLTGPRLDEAPPNVHTTNTETKAPREE